LTVRSAAFHLLVNDAFAMWRWNAAKSSNSLLSLTSMMNPP